MAIYDHSNGGLRVTIVVVCLKCIVFTGVLTLLLQVFPVVDNVLAQTITFSEGIRIHWSERKTINSPGRIWELDIVPPENEDSPTPVCLRKPLQDKTHLLFEFDREGKIFWQRDEALFVEDRKSSNNYRIMLFNSLDKYPYQGRGLVIDDVIRSDIRKKINTEEIIFYYPHFVSWTENKLVVSVEVITLKDENVPTISYCFGYEIDAQSLEIRASLTEKELISKYKTDCREWP